MTTQKDKLAKWKALTPAQRKVEIAKDAKAQVLASKYTVCSANGYIVPRDVKQYERLLSLVGRKSTKDPVTGYAVNQLASNCELCARGALLLSRIRQFNQLSYEDVGFSRGTRNKAFPVLSRSRSCAISRSRLKAGTDRLTGVTTSKPMTIVCWPFFKTSSITMERSNGTFPTSFRKRNLGPAYYVKPDRRRSPRKSLLTCMGSGGERPYRRAFRKSR